MAFTYYQNVIVDKIIHVCEFYRKLVSMLCCIVRDIEIAGRLKACVREPVIKNKASIDTLCPRRPKIGCFSDFNIKVIL